MSDVEKMPVQPYSTDPNEVVAFTQAIRYRQFDELTDNGTQLIARFDDVSKLLKDMDNAALMTRKLNIEAKQAEDGSKTLHVLNRLEQVLQGKDPFEVSQESPLPIAERVTPLLPNNMTLPEVTMIPGEGSQGEQPLSIANYVSEDE